MSNLRKRSTSPHSAPDADSSKKKTKTGTENVSSSSENDEQGNNLTAHWLKIKQEAESSERSPKNVVRRVLRYLGQGISRSSADRAGVSPTDILPEEMWRETLDYISEPVDLMNCAGTCKLFKSIVEKLKTRKLFGRVLPLITNYLRNEEIVKCRLVCSQWDIGVCSNAAWGGHTQPHDATAWIDLEVGKYLRYLKLRPQKREWFGSHYSFNLPTSSAHVNQNNAEVLQQMKLHPRNPFVGGEVDITSINPSTPDEPSFCTEMKIFLHNFGNHLTGLYLGKDDSYQPDTYKDVCSLVTCVFKSCPNLRSFAMDDHACQPKADTDSDAEIMDLPDHSSIRWIDIDWQECHDISYQVFAKYSNQLIYLFVNEWNAEFVGSFHWNFLKCLDFTDEMSQGFSNVVKSMFAPQLGMIRLHCTPNRTTFRDILEAISSAPRVWSLEITYPGVMEPVSEQNEILSMSAETICQTCILDLGLKLTNGFISFDFLLLFPFLKTLGLNISFETNAGNAKIAEEIDFLMRAGDSFSSAATTDSAVTDTGRTQSEMGYLLGRIVHINEHLVKIVADDGTNSDADVCMYRSNVWKLLPFLQTIIVYHSSHSIRYKLFRRSRFLDGGYEERRKQFKAFGFFIGK